MNNPHIANQAAPGKFATEIIEFPDLTDSSRNGRKIPIKVHAPQQGGPFPVIAVSHGAGGNWDVHYAQAQHLASHGYVVLCLEHTGSNTQRLLRGAPVPKNIMEMLTNPRILQNMMDMTRDADEVLGRPRDIGFAIDCASDWNRSNDKLRGRLDLERVGALGHSFGAFTTMALCGMRPALNWLTPRVEPGSGVGPDLSDPRVKCGVALSPQGANEPFFLTESFAYLKAPLLGMSGTNDDQQKGLPAETRLQAFALWPAGPHKFVWITPAGHMDFTDPTGSTRVFMSSPTRADVQTIVRAASLLFFDAHLKADVSAERQITTEGFRTLLHGPVTDVEVRSK